MNYAGRLTEADFRRGLSVPPAPVSPSVHGVQAKHGSTSSSQTTQVLGQSGPSSSKEESTSAEKPVVPSQKDVKPRGSVFVDYTTGAPLTGSLARVSPRTSTQQ
jgi:hypothetical protein